MMYAGCSPLWVAFVTVLSVLVAIGLVVGMVARAIEQMNEEESRR